ncbi:hypothetical protein GB937_001073 [Aspergillus fischeri]|nr:hypothetical protein GB937_001073 [Aspergillus fischeri]
MAPTARDQMRPPSPEPAALMPIARLLRRWNHCGVIPTLPTNRKPIPQPKQTPWLRKICHFCVAKEDPIKDRVSKKTPRLRTNRVPKRWIRCVASGATRSAQEMLRPPVKAYDNALVLGKTSCER